MDWIGFALAVLLIELTPGPNMAWLATLPKLEGRRAGLIATAGVALGLTLNGILAAFGLAALVASDPRLWSALRWSGAAFMLWLSWQAWRDSKETSPTMLGQSTATTRHFWSGLTVNLLNPKAFIFYVIIAPQFLTQHMASLSQALTLTAISVCIATLVHLTLVIGAARFHAWVSDTSRTRWVRRVMAIALLGVAIWFLSSSAIQI